MSALFTVADVAAKLNLKPQKVGGKLEYHGANPKGGAGENGFILFEAGNALDRKTETKYTSPQVAQMAGLSPDEYAPFLEWKARNGNQNGRADTNGAAGAQSPPKRPESPQNGKSAGAAPFDWKRAQTFDYQDETGALLFQVGRTGEGAAKQIRQRRPDGRGGWLYSLGDVRRVLWRLPDVLAAQTVFLCEGEKAAAALNLALEKSGQVGAIATTNAQGAGKWRDEFCESLDGKAVCVLPDFDEPGDKHGAAVCASIYASGRAAAVCRLDLPSLPPKGDVCDWLESGGTVADLLELRDASPQWEPAREPEPAPRFDFQTLAQLKARPAPQWLIHRLLTRGGTSLLTAKHASFKSFFALDMALCVATGTLWQGFEVARGPVVYVAAEGAAGLTKRAQAWESHHQTDAGESFIVLDVPLKIHEPETRAQFIGAIGAIAPMLIVLDTLARCAVGLDENSSGDMGTFADAVGELARVTGAHVMTVHHNNKTGDYRGSSALPAAVDTHLSLERRRDGETDVANLKTEKQKDFEELETLSFEARQIAIPGTNGEGHSLIFEKTDTRPGGEFSVSRAEQNVFDELKGAFGEEGATASQWGKVCEERGISNRTFRYAKEKLVEIGAVLCPDKGARGAKFTSSPDWGKSGQVGAKSGQSPHCPEPSESRGSRGNTPLGVAPSCPDSEDGAAGGLDGEQNSEGAKVENSDGAASGDELETEADEMAGVDI